MKIFIIALAVAIATVCGGLLIADCISQKAQAIEHALG